MMLGGAQNYNRLICRFLNWGRKRANFVFNKSANYDFACGLLSLKKKGIDLIILNLADNTK